MSTQMSLLEEAGVEVREPEPMTEVKLGHRSTAVAMRKKRRQALDQLVETLDQLEGKDVYIGWCGGARSNFWLNNLKLGRLKVEKPWWWFDKDHPPKHYGAPVIVLWGSRGASVRIFTDLLEKIREQEYQGYTLWLVDFWNGFGEYPIDPFKPQGCESLEIVRFKD
ncbi:hypothetical protein ES703_81382 [subsurface metagenome]